MKEIDKTKICKECRGEYSSKWHNSKYCGNPCDRFYKKKTDRSYKERKPRPAPTTNGLGDLSRKYLSMRL